MKKGPLSGEEKKKMADEYLALQRKIRQLTQESEKLYANFTPSMKTYVKKSTEHEELEKNIEQRISKLGEMSEKMNEMNAGIKITNEEMRKLLDMKKENTFSPQNDTHAEKSKGSEYKENIPSTTHFTTPRTRM